MTLRTVLALALLGLFGGTHCLAMCGPLAGLFSSRLTARGARRALGLGAFHGGRLGAYSALGALAGVWGAAGLTMSPSFGALVRVLAGVLVVVYGLRLAGVVRRGAGHSPIGAVVGGPVKRALGALLPLSSPPRALCAGALWALIPCGLVYSALVVCASAGEPLAGALGMLAFGLGALPWLLFVDALAGLARALAGRAWARRAAGAVVVLVGVLGAVSGAQSWGERSSCHARGGRASLEDVALGLRAAAGRL